MGQKYQEFWSKCVRETRNSGQGPPAASGPGYGALTCATEQINKVFICSRYYLPDVYFFVFIARVVPLSAKKELLDMCNALRTTLCW